MDKKNARLITYYLPQFYPTPENDRWWGDGFTEWVSVRRAKPLFWGHDQPRVPGELGYYDLRDAKVRSAQAELARQHGIEGFCYWHYWFAGKRLLDLPFNEVLASGKPEFPFCLGWANHSWTKKNWYGGDTQEVLMEQTYPGIEDYRNHFFSILGAFKDKRYLTVHGKKIFLVYAPHAFPKPTEFVRCWRALAQEAGLPGLYLIATSQNPDMVKIHGFDAITPDEPAAMLRCYVSRARRFVFHRRLNLKHNSFHRKRYRYGEVTKHAFLYSPSGVIRHPCVIPGWDVSPRYKKDGWLLTGSTPGLFRKHLKGALESLSSHDPEQKLLFVKSWNEWSEGNYLEPDQRFGRAYLEAIRAEVFGKALP